MADKEPPVKFVGAISDSKNAISFGSHGIRVQFDIPETHSIEANKLTLFRNRILTITIEVEEDGEKIGNRIKEW
jgi:hypothetical protein